MFVDNDSAHDAEPLCDNPVVALVVRARDGDERAWAALVERYAPLIWSLCRRYRLDATDTADVGQNVWLLLVTQLGKIRDPAALPGWLATTTRRECARVLNKAQARQAARHEPDAENIPDGQAETIEQGLLAAERHAALRPNRITTVCAPSGLARRPSWLTYRSIRRPGERSPFLPLSLSEMLLIGAAWLRR